MSTNPPQLILEEDNLSFAWAKAFLMALDGSKSRLAPLTISIGPFSGLPKEDKDIRAAIDVALCDQKKFSSHVSAAMIFPKKFWLALGKPSCKELTDHYLRDLHPRLLARGGVHTMYGTYFERMVDFHGLERKKKSLVPLTRNQLGFIIDLWKENQKRGQRPRQSALVVSCLDPAKDHTRQPLRGFPCLQQVSFGYDDEDGLSLSAYYPTQYLFDRAYGNYLGLSHLGEFMAEQLGLKLCRLNFFIGRPELGDVNKSALANIRGYLTSVLKDKGA